MKDMAIRILVDPGSFNEMAGMFDCGPGECWADANNEDGTVTIIWGMTKDENSPQSQVTVATALR